MGKKISSEGFTAIAIILIAVVVLAVGAAGWYIIRGKDEKKQTNNSQQASSDKTKETTKQLTDANKYLIIKEWNLRIELPENLSDDISYFINNQAERDFGGPVRVDFTSGKFSAGSLKCAVVEGDQPRVLVSIYKEVNGAGGVTQVPQPFKQIDNIRYYFTVTSCEEAIDREGTPQDKQLLTDLKDAIASTLQNYPGDNSN